MKKILNISLWLICTIIFALFFLKNSGYFFENGATGLWQKACILLLAGASSIILTAILYCVEEWNKIKPYMIKFLKYKTLLMLLVERDFKAKYKRSVLGILWTVLNPLLTMIVLTIVFSTLFRFEIENYPVYLLCGQIIFGFYTEATNMSMSSILGSANLIKKVSIPKYIFPLSRVLSSLVNLALSMVALLIVMILTGTQFHLTMLLIPLPVIYIFLFSTGIGLILSTAVIFFRDINYLYGIVLTMLTYLTPLFYPISIIPDDFMLIIKFNPMYYFVKIFRMVTMYGEVPNFSLNIFCAMLSLFTFCVGMFVFYKKQDRFILYV